MTSKTFGKILMAVCAGLLLVPLGPAPSLGQSRGGVQTPPPIELTGITIEYAVLNDIGDLVWETPGSATPNAIPAVAQRLRFRATVTNRQPGSRIRLRAVFQEVCPMLKTGRRFLAKLRHLTESDPGNLTADPADDEEQTVKPDGTVSIETLVHCDVCPENACGKRCSGNKDHLGEGPHLVTLTATDPQSASPVSERGAARPHETHATRPSSFKVELTSFCPGARWRPSPTRRGTPGAGRVRRAAPARRLVVAPSMSSSSSAVQPNGR